MRIKALLFLLFTAIFIFGCKSSRYTKIIDEVNSYQIIHDMDTAKRAITILDEAIKMEPHRWEAYSKEIQTYIFWSHIPEEFADNQEGVKLVYDRWIENGNSFNLVQKFCYANTLYTLGEYEKANEYYHEVFESYNPDNPSTTKEWDYISYILTGAVLGIINHENFSEWLNDSFDDEHNPVLLETITDLEDYSNRQELLKSYCICY